MNRIILLLTFLSLSITLLGQDATATDSIKLTFLPVDTCVSSDLRCNPCFSSLTYDEANYPIEVEGPSNSLKLTYQ